MKKILPVIIVLGLVSCDKPKQPTETEQKQEDYKKKYPVAQIATEFRLRGLEPFVTDYILYKQINPAQ